MKSKIFLMIPILIILIAFSSCKKEESNQESSVYELESASQEESSLHEAESTSQEESSLYDAESANKDAMTDKYQSVLNGIYYDHVNPDGSECYFDDFSDMSENEFAIYDVDADGKDELIINYASACIAGMAEYIYNYDEEKDSVDLELQEYPLITYYSNGMITAGLSHNQGMAGDKLWPYSLYRYNCETDTYDIIATVDAWDKSLFPTDFESNPFPENVDTNNDGVVYYIMKDGNYEYTNPISKEEYDTWYQSEMGDAKETVVPFQKMTEENIVQVSNSNLE